VPAAEVPKPVKQGTTINSPMVGTFYKSSSPDAEPFVRPGVRVVPDKTLCIIEAMKVMNEIKCEISGEILEVLVENGAPVEFGQPLFLVKTD
jgi:acetyl-CoA carboxylase biotin carboxyl carrier protein